MLKRYDGTTYVNKMHLLFRSSSRKNSEVKRAWPGAISKWVTYGEIFSGSMRVRTKHARKIYVGLWGQSLIRKVAVT